MKGRTSHARYHIDPAEGRQRSVQQKNASKLPSIILAVAPSAWFLAYALIVLAAAGCSSWFAEVMASVL
jgi:hypothetical protein